MKAARIHRFGPPGVIELDHVPVPVPAADQVLIRVKAAGVGPWDALIREHKSVIDAPLPITLGSDLAGVVEAAGSPDCGFRHGEEVYGVTNAQFIGAYAEYALAGANRIARKPEALNWFEAASAPVVAVTALQMLDYAKAGPGQSVLIHGAGGNVGAYAVQLAAQSGLQVFATASALDAAYVRELGATTVIDYRQTRFEEAVPPVDIVLDTVGGETRERSYRTVKPGGVLVTIVSQPLSDASKAVRTVFFLADVTTGRLNQLTERFNRRQLLPRAGTVLPLDQARAAHEMLAGAPHRPGKIVLNTSPSA